MSANIVKTILGYIIGYIRSSVFMFVVLPTFAIFFMGTMPMSGNILVWIIQHLSFIDSNFALSKFEMDASDFAKLFFFISLVFFLISEILRLVGLKITITFLKGTIIISSLFVIGTVLSIFLQHYEQGTTIQTVLGVSLFFYITSIIFYYIWYKLGRLGEIVSKITN